MYLFIVRTVSVTCKCMFCSRGVMGCSVCSGKKKQKQNVVLFEKHMRKLRCPSFPLAPESNHLYTFVNVSLGLCVTTYTFSTIFDTNCTRLKFRKTTGTAEWIIYTETVPHVKSPGVDAGAVCK